jgi:hypothetical protein
MAAWVVEWYEPGALSLRGGAPGSGLGVVSMALTQASRLRGRGVVAVTDMKARLAAGWTVDQLWCRLQQAEFGNGFVYDYAEKLPAPDLVSVED